MLSRSKAYPYRFIFLVTLLIGLLAACGMEAEPRGGTTEALILQPTAAPQSVQAPQPTDAAASEPPREPEVAIQPDDTGEAAPAEEVPEPPPAEPEQPAALEPEAPQTDALPAASSDPRAQGDPNAPITVVVYSDFQ